jgi:formate dehydrogenase major subunit
MTNGWTDLKETDCALIIGSNCAENHPISFKWLTKARDERGAKIVVVDPRFTRSAAKADIYAPLRSGADIAFMGGMINYILQNKLYWKDYVLHYTNAAFIVGPGYDYKDGLFSGFDPKTKRYDAKAWDFEMEPGEEGKPPRAKADPTLSNPRCVLNLLQKHYSRYDLDTVSRVTGTPKEKLEEVYQAFAATGKPDKSGVIMYAMGTTQHTVGSQNVRAYAIVQLLLGNLGVPGGGVAALRGESNVQGSTDAALLFHLLPGYIGAPNGNADHATLEAYLKKETPPGGFRANLPKWLISLLKAWYGEAATKENEFGYQWLPKKDPKKNYSHIALFEAMYAGTIKGLFTWGQNPLVGGPNCNKEAKAMENLDWYVAVDLFEIETAQFWKRPGANPADIKTEVFLLPACSSIEKEGTVSNSGRITQFRWKAVEPMGDARPDLDIAYELFHKIRELYQGSKAAKDQGLLNLTWSYGEIPSVHAVAREINGQDLATGKQMATFAALKDDGSTTSGNWIYCGMFPEEGKYLAERRDPTEKAKGIYSNWAYSWPVNRRILYNRCSADPTGKPWSEDKKVMWWDPAAPGDPKKPEDGPGAFAGYDVPDFNKFLKPDKSAAAPFIMQVLGKGALYANAGMAEGPLPEHYEPWEAPMKNAFSSVQMNPVVKVWEPDKQGTLEQFPIICTTFRLSEHYQTGALTRNQPWLAELAPYMFVEIGEELAAEKGIKQGQKVIVSSARGEIEVYAMVTKRWKPLEIDGRTVHEIGMPWHYGFAAIAKGESANVLTPHIGDANTMIPEYKAFLVDVRGV